MRIAYFDAFGGISGDMTLGALVDAGVDAVALKNVVARLGLPCELTFETVRRAGFRATLAKVVAAPEHVHRHLHHIETIIDKAELTPRQADLAKRIFRKLGEAEARAHGIDIGKVHFHEVGAVDSIVDIVCAAVGIDLLGVERIEASPLPPGRGTVKGAHGVMPLPAPATAELLKGIPLAESTADFEQTTPTGAAILATFADAFGPLPALTIEAIGLGAGTRDPVGSPNIVRLFVGQTATAKGSDRVWMLETNLDDVPGEVVGYTTQKLLAAGALDAFTTAIAMKKNRPGVMVSALCEESKIAVLEDILFRETATLGIRRYSVARHKLARESVVVETRFGPIRVKIASIDGRAPVFSPEHDDCARVALAGDLPLREVHDAVCADHANRQSLTNTPKHEHPHTHEHEH